MKFIQLAIYLSLFVSSTSFAFGKARLSQSKQLLETLENKKQALMKDIDRVPYRKEQHSSIKEYFENLLSLNEELADDEKLVEKFNEIILDLDVTATCRKIFLDEETFQRVMRNCTKNRFFLCSESVRKYQTLKAEFKSKLTDENRKRFEQTGCLDGLPR